MRWKSSTALPETIGGSADLTGSNNTKTSQMKAITRDGLLRPLHPLRHPRTRHGGGDERHALHGGLIPYSGGFLIFSDYCRPADPPCRPDGHPRHSRHDA
jgi:transketolase